ncbi:Os03g0738200 [Oryza sativa Japonica Group]|jgi:PI-3-kinase-related kinase SMG-1|uniref:Os03g0738200 protein n=3 Tax=Magnoliopsida TaxID=3398 RepID=A0A0P0W2S9_ORYSJ|nr:hypothetical protein EE612_020325 [Oryza sativa]BAS86286.1 Os03g0738200 [Oryza sativa Japonica Group]
MPSTHADILQSDSSIEKDKGSSGSREGGSQDLVTTTDLSLQDECWISPPEHSYTSSSGYTTELTQITSSENIENMDPLLVDRPVIEAPGANDQERGADSESDSSSNKQLFINNVTLTNVNSVDEVEISLSKERKSENENTNLPFKQIRGQECDNSDPKSYPDSVTRLTRGKNPFALSILKQVEHKLHGWDIDGTRSLKVSEQVDHLLKQATSIDNLCNMYEGWTPWI